MPACAGMTGTLSRTDTLRGALNGARKDLRALRNLRHLRPPLDCEMNRDDQEAIARVAGRVLSERAGRDVTLRAGDVFRTAGSVVVRCHVTAASGDWPPTVIAKCAAETYGPY